MLVEQLQHAEARHSRRSAPSRPATTTSPLPAPAVSSRRIHGTPAAGGSMSMPAISITFGMEPRVAIPMPPHAVQSIAIARVAGLVRRKLEAILQNRSLAAL